jgi:hypothetical protein
MENVSEKNEENNQLKEKRRRMNSLFVSFSRRPQLSACIALGLAVFAVYFPALSNGFLMLWDDQWVVINNYTYHGLAPDNLWRILTEFYHGQYAPLNQFYYTCLYSAFGLNPFAFHPDCRENRENLTGAGWKSRFFSGIFHGETKKFQRITGLISAISKKIKFFRFFIWKIKILVLSLPQIFW